jgi:hypothetical protein
MKSLLKAELLEDVCRWGEVQWKNFSGKNLKGTKKLLLKDSFSSS